MDYSTLSDRELEVLVTGECPEGALESFIVRHAENMARMARSVYGIEEHAVADLVSAAVETFCEKRHSLQAGYLKRWLYQVVIYHCLNHRRKQRRKERMARQLKDLGEPGYGDGRGEAILCLDVMEAMKKFRAKERAFLYNVLVEQRTVSELAHAEGKTVRGIEMRKASLLKKLRAELENKTEGAS